MSGFAGKKVRRGGRGQQEEQRMCQVVTRMDPHLSEDLRKRDLHGTMEEMMTVGKARLMATFLLVTGRCVSKSGAKWRCLACVATFTKD